MILSIRQNIRSGRTRNPAPRPAVMLLAVLMAGGLAAGSARGAEPVFAQLLPARITTVMLEHGNKLLRGLDGGGLVVEDRLNPQASELWTAGRDLSGNNISDLVWTGENIWIATLGAGLTRVTNLESAPEFRQYTNNLGSLDISAVTGTVIAGGGERVFYGMAGRGLGQINSGLSGNIYTADQDGLISDNVTALQMFRDDLFVGTTVGISLFAGNIFTDQNAGLTSLMINDLILDSDGDLLAATGDGVYRWDPAGQTWLLLEASTVPVVDLAAAAGKTYALGMNSNGSGTLREYDGSVWSAIALPYTQCTALAAGEDLWIGGPLQEVTGGGKLMYNYLGRRLAGDDFDTTVSSSTQVLSSVGVAFDADGGSWMGESSGFQITRYDPRDDSYLFIYERPYAANDTLNLFPGLGPVLGIAGAPDGTVYAGQYYGGGVLKFNPATMTTDLMDPDNSGLQGRTIVNLVVHPDGPLIVLHDMFDSQRVEVLVDPENWSEETSWMLPPMDEGLGSGTSVWDALVERRDIIWFAVESGGLVRWDINGPDAGPDDPLTWFDQSDDVWYEPVTDFPGTYLDPAGTRGLALGRDGSLWAGGNGLVQFTYEILGGTFLGITTKLAVKEKSSSDMEGLVNGNVKDIAVDKNGDVWVATSTGLNRVSPRGDEALISAWIDLANYLANPVYGVLYSPNVIASLPGNTYAKISPSVSGDRMLLSSDQGTTLITVGSGPGSGAVEEPLQGVYCFPNPWVPGEPADRLRLGGLSQAVVRVDVYNLEGLLVFTDKSVAEDTGFWEGGLSRGRPVSSGMYILKITLDGVTATRLLAVVR